jgi:hypothetical protein
MKPDYPPGFYKDAEGNLRLDLSAFLISNGLTDTEEDREKAYVMLVEIMGGLENYHNLEIDGA